MKKFFKIVWASFTLLLVFPFAPKRCISIIRAKPVSFNVKCTYSSQVENIYQLFVKNDLVQHLALSGKESIAVSKKTGQLIVWAKTSEDATIIKMKMSDRDLKDVADEFDPWSI